MWIYLCFRARTYCYIQGPKIIHFSRRRELTDIAERVMIVLTAWWSLGAPVEVGDLRRLP